MSIEENLQVIVDSCSLDVDVSGILSSMNLFIVVNYGSKELKTDICYDCGKEGSWKKKFDLGAGDNASVIMVTVHNEGLMSSDEIGHCKICID